MSYWPTYCAVSHTLPFWKVLRAGTHACPTRVAFVPPSKALAHEYRSVSDEHAAPSASVVRARALPTASARGGHAACRLA